MRRIAAVPSFSVAAALCALALAGSVFAATFTTWTGAQSAAGFPVLKPGTVFGLDRVGGISVSRCEVTGQLSKRQVGAGYGHSSSHSLAIVETNAPFPCGNGEDVSLLRHVLVHGHRARLSGLCGGAQESPCSSPMLPLYELDWHEHGLTLVATAQHLSSAKLIEFARSLHPV